jgi:hypothetical protein
MATREEAIRKALRETKGPSTKRYVAILVVVGLVLSLYFLLSAGGFDFLATSAAPVKIESSEHAQSVQSNLGQGVQGVSARLDGIGSILGG